MLAEQPTSGLLTSRDLEMVRWLDRLVGASVDHVRRRFALGQSQAYRRLRVLEEHGLIDRRAVLAGRPVLYTVRARELGPSTYAHAAGVASLVADLELSGARVVTDVELRGLRSRQRSFVPLDRLALETFIACARTPDVIVCLGEGRLGAYEVELSSKGRNRRESILTSYALSDYEFVHWIAPDPSIRKLLCADIAAMGLTGRMEVIG